MIYRLLFLVFASFAFAQKQTAVKSMGEKGCSDSKKCNIGEGDCDKDSHCKGSLKCAQRSNWDTLKGKGLTGFKKYNEMDWWDERADSWGAFDYCYDPNWGKTTTPTPTPKPTPQPTPKPTPQPQQTTVDDEQKPSEQEINLETSNSETDPSVLIGISVLGGLFGLWCIFYYVYKKRIAERVDDIIPTPIRHSRTRTQSMEIGSVIQLQTSDPSVDNSILAKSKQFGSQFLDKIDNSISSSAHKQKRSTKWQQPVDKTKSIGITTKTNSFQFSTQRRSPFQYPCDKCLHFGYTRTYRVVYNYTFFILLFTCLMPPLALYYLFKQCFVAICPRHQVHHHCSNCGSKVAHYVDPEHNPCFLKQCRMLDLEEDNYEDEGLIFHQDQIKQPQAFVKAVFKGNEKRNSKRRAKKTHAEA